MKPQSRPESGQLDMFQTRSEQSLNLDHPLFVLAGQTDWARFDAAFAASYCQGTEAPAKAIRLLVGPQYLKHAFSLSDEALVDS